MTRVVKLKIVPMTEESFEPFGEILAVKSRPPDIRGVADSWLVDFHTGGRAQVRAMRSYSQPLGFGKLERHFGVTQTFIPIGGSPSVVAMAAPTDNSDRSAVPAPDQVRAFLIEGARGFVLKKGTWHSLDRYPLYGPASDFVMLSDWETSDEVHAVAPDKDKWRWSQEVDYEARFGVVFEFEFVL